MIRRFESFGGHPLITQRLFEGHSDCLEIFRREMVTLTVEVLDEHTRKMWIELKGDRTGKTLGYAFVSNNPDFNNFKQALLGELEDLGIAIIDS